ncbi:hypothetical protein AX14_006872 [Amanita brunnescens Koide BX004]|nr:hypothetical protein AX14_006872 [Amanita brunnescens Koide BX004]
MTVRVLLTNDDGPPDTRESPYVLGLYQHLVRDLGWDVKVVLPSSQRSWIAKAYFVKQTIRGSYFYPRDDGQGEVSVHSRPLKAGEIAEWILLDGTPATCSNIALHNLYPGQIDLVISGPNLGWNTSSAFALSSGTIGAALSSSLSKTRSIALSYGHPRSTDVFEPVHILSCNIIQYLWKNWGKDEGGSRNGEVDLYSVNVPMVDGSASDSGLKICWTSIWRNSYGSLFANVSGSGTLDPVMGATGPHSSTPVSSLDSKARDLLFSFSPESAEYLAPSDPPVGSDAWAIRHGWVSVTPLRASFAQPPVIGDKATNKVWEIKL